MEKNKIMEVDVVDVSYQGFGVAKVDGFPIFIDGALTGERVEIKIDKVLKKFAFASVTKFITQSDDRVALKFEDSKASGTMPLQHMSYEAQLKFKKQQVINSLSKIIDISDVKIYDTLGMDNPWQYRNKAQVPVRNLNGKLETGYFKQSSHELVPMEDFHIQDPKIDEAIVIVRDILRELEIPAYDPVKHRGIIRNISVRRGHYTGEVMVVLVCNVKEFDKLDILSERIFESVPGIVSLVQNINTKQTNLILGRKSRVLKGVDYYSDMLNGQKFYISSHSFYQVNSLQTEVLYKTAIELANIQKTDVVVDAYCGIGTIALSLANSAKHVYGMDIIGDAITMAKKNALENKIKNVTFESGDAQDVLGFWHNEGLEIDVLLVDPPRKGLDEAFINNAIEAKPERIVYVSCNPATLARDVSRLEEGGYKLISAQPVDMFPQTVHVECIALLQREIS
ncbi:MAG: 23S rRNA (uracil(1939)-C(5))-methyltransferase RlmD [Erysipelothrix sp.]|nr:23S rRNA (uracil(1939)-C(5))-methyltransferase RlmD [Erysipelothrix sp.]